MKLKTAKRWFWWHKWTSLICTVFLLMLCVTGLPLIFHHEIDNLLHSGTDVTIPNSAHKMSIDALCAKANTVYPGEKARAIYVPQKDGDKIAFNMAASPDAPPPKSKVLELNAYTGEVLAKPDRKDFMNIILKIHTDMFVGIPGKLFLGLMGILFIIALISGVVLYGPIMKNFDFGMVRKYKSRRLKWLDTHNLLGIVMLAWTTVVGLTGIINTSSDIILFLWQKGQLSEMTAPYAKARPLTGQLSSIDSAVAVASKVLPSMEPSIIAFPGTMFTSKHHYVIFLKGKTPLTSRLLVPVLIDAQNGKFTDSRKTPWYVNTLFLSEPLHFGDYGGMPLKIIWALFDIGTIIILITGLYLWFKRRKANKLQWSRIVVQQTNYGEE